MYCVGGCSFSFDKTAVHVKREVTTSLLAPYQVISFDLSIKSSFNEVDLQSYKISDRRAQMQSDEEDGNAAAADGLAMTTLIISTCI